MRSTSLRSGKTTTCGCLRNSDAFAAKKKNLREPDPVEGARWIPLTKGAFALVDVSDFAALSKFNWCLAVRGYAARRKNGRVIPMHQEITGTKGIDHKNRNKMDNRRTNLRVASQLNNTRNRDSLTTSHNPSGIRTSVFKGVCWSSARKHWRANIGVGGKQKYIGVFASEEAAAKAYDVVALKLFGEFAVLNAARLRSRVPRKL